MDEAKDYHLMPERRTLLQTFKTRPRCCSDVPGIIYAVGGLTSSGISNNNLLMLRLKFLVSGQGCDTHSTFRNLTTQVYVDR